MENKLLKLENYLRETGGAVLAYSGGVDSAFLLNVARLILKDKFLAVIGVSDTFPKEELQNATALAEKLNTPYLVIETNEMRDANFINNPPERCYFCKKELFTQIAKIAKKHNYNYILDGSNADDINDFRPGMKAAKEMGVLSPLKEVGLTKQEIRTLSKQAGLPTWDKPAMACLSSRFPYGTPITKDKLNMVEQAEAFLRKNGLRQIRVRIHDQSARIEVESTYISKITQDPLKSEISTYLKELGFKFVSIDLDGFKSGNMNATLPEVENES